jgi:molybdopterin/thiamine biosynthesis adenylyltransferase
MDHAYHTRELAKAYESQGYDREALDIYTELDRKFQGTDSEVAAACRRLETRLVKTASGKREGRLKVLLEDWFTLWRTSHHLTTMNHLMAQVRSRK